VYTVSFVDVVSVIIVMVVMRCYGDVAMVTVCQRSQSVLQLLTSHSQLRLTAAVSDWQRLPVS